MANNSSESPKDFMGPMVKSPKGPAMSTSDKNPNKHELPAAAEEPSGKRLKPTQGATDDAPYDAPDASGPKPTGQPPVGPDALAPTNVASTGQALPAPSPDPSPSPAPSPYPAGPLAPAAAPAAATALPPNVGPTGGEIEAVTSSIKAVESQIEAVESEIKGVKSQIDDANSEIKKQLAAEKRDETKLSYWMGEKEQLREDKKLLCKKEEQLREQLLEKEKQLGQQLRQEQVRIPVKLPDGFPAHVNVAATATLTDLIKAVISVAEQLKRSLSGAVDLFWSPAGGDQPQPLNADVIPALLAGFSRDPSQPPVSARYPGPVLTRSDLAFVEFPTPLRPRDKLLDRKHPLETASRYLEQVLSIGPEKPGDAVFKDGKTTIVGTSGMKGIGKTELLKHIGKYLAPKVFKPVYITFNGQGAQVQKLIRAGTGPKELMASFGRMLLKACNPAALPVPKRVTWKEAWRLLPLDPEERLLVLLDELGELDKAHPGVVHDFLSKLMHVADTSTGKLAFIFSHLMPDLLLEMASGSGRRVEVLELPLLDLRAHWKDIPAWKAAAQKHPGIHQLFLSCSGHPRALYDGIQAALDMYPSLLETALPTDLILARETIISVCKFNSIRRETVVEALRTVFPQPNAEWGEQQRRWHAEGLLHRGSKKEGVAVFLNPLVLQNWARTSDEPEAVHLRGLYAADAFLGLASEKYMEAVLYHFEALLVAFSRDEFRTLGEIFPTDFNGLADNYQFHRKRPRSLQTGYVRYFPDFSDVPVLLEVLREGYIVVSEHSTERGVEFLVPFFDKNESLHVAFVQCKFVADAPNWTQVREQMLPLLQAFKDNSTPAFPVILTNADRQRLRPKSYRPRVNKATSHQLPGQIVLTARELFLRTHVVGILRMHTEKLGSALANEHPFLKRARSDLGLESD